MKNIIYTTIIVATLFAYKLYAQGDIPDDLGYEPPDGWEYVMKLDSLNLFRLNCHNDSCLIRLRKRGGVRYEIISSDGGRSWNNYDIEKILPEHPALYEFMYNSPERHGLLLKKKEKGSEYYYWHTTDFHQNIKEYLILDNFSGNYLPYKLYQNPLEPNVLIAVTKFSFSQNISHFPPITEWVMDFSPRISRDGGKTWEKLDLPTMKYGYTIYTFFPDWSKKGHWIVLLEDGYDLFQEVGSIRQENKYIETYDNFETIEDINLDYKFVRWSASPLSTSSPYYTDSAYYKPIVGLDGKGTYRNWESSIPAYISNYKASYYGINVGKYEKEIKNTTVYDWLYIMDPTKPRTNLDSGYRNFLYNKLFHYDNSEYSYHLISRTEFDFTNIDSTRYSFLYQSTNLGKEWELLYFFENVRKPPYIYQSFLDQGTKTLWMYVYDDETLSANQIRKGSLWKLKLNWNSTNVEDLSDKNKIIIYPNPANNNISIIIPEINNKVKINIMDLYGREIVNLYEGFANEHKLELKLPENISSGTYFVKVVISSEIIVEKLVIIR